MKTIEEIVANAENEIYALTGVRHSLFIREKIEVIYGIDKDVILNALSDVTGFTEYELKSKSRVRALSEARMLLMKLLREKGKMTLHDIARFINRDHSTVIHGIRTIKNLQEHSFGLRMTEMKIGEILNTEKDLTK